MSRSISFELLQIDEMSDGRQQAIRRHISFIRTGKPGTLHGLGFKGAFITAARGGQRLPEVEFGFLSESSTRRD